MSAVASALSNRKNRTCARKTQYKHNEDGCTVPGVCGNGSEPLGERRYENWNTHTKSFHTYFILPMNIILTPFPTISIIGCILYHFYSGCVFPIYLIWLHKKLHFFQPLLHLARNLHCAK